MLKEKHKQVIGVMQVLSQRQIGHTLCVTPEPVPRCLSKLFGGPPDVSLGVYMYIKVFDWHHIAQKRVFLDQLSAIKRV